MTKYNPHTRFTDLGLDYRSALHGCQSAIAHRISLNGEKDASASPKHLRMGVDSSMITDAAIVNLLIKKGIFTMEEFDNEVRLAANDELARWQQLFGVTFR
jgi:hypothetical protein